MGLIILKVINEVTMLKEDLINLQSKVSKLRAEGKYEETIESAYILLKLGKEFEDYKSQLVAFINLAASYYCLGDMEEAFNSIMLYSDICDKHGDVFDELNYHNILFLIYEYNKSYDKARTTLEDSIALGEKLKKYNIVSNGYSNYSHICICQEDYKKALEMGFKGLEAAKFFEPPMPILEMRVKLNIARAYIGLKDFQSSKDIIDDMLKDPILEGFIREKTEAYHLQGEWFSSQGLYKEAFEALTTAKCLVESYGDEHLLKTVLEERCKLCEFMEDVSLGYEVQKEYIKLLEDIKDKEAKLTALRLEIKCKVAELELKANTDPLTGVYNRNYIEIKANNWLRQIEKNNEKIITCILLDVDDFKSINDNYGHLIGDEAIKQASKACKDVIKAPNIIGRYGGDEFIAILNTTTLEESEEMVQAIRNKVNNLTIYTKDGQLEIKLSMGVSSTLNSKSNSFKQLLEEADIKLYKEKQNNKCQ